MMMNMIGEESEISLEVKEVNTSNDGHGGTTEIAAIGETGEDETAGVAGETKAGIGREVDNIMEDQEGTVRVVMDK